MKISKEKIVALAVRLIAEKGYDSFSYADLSTELGIRKASLHHHFPKKEDLGVAVMNAVLAELSTRFDKIRQAQGDVEERLDIYLAMAREMSVNKGCLCPISSLQAECSVLPECMRSRLHELGEKELDFITDMLSEGKRTQIFTFTAKPRVVAMVFLSAIKGGMQYTRTHGASFFDDSVKGLKCLLKNNLNK